MYRRQPEEHVSRILGFGLDHEDGHVRVTEGDLFTLLMGSEATHEEMKDILKRIEEEAAKSGRTLDELSREDFIRLARELPLRK